MVTEKLSQKRKLEENIRAITVALHLTEKEIPTDAQVEQLSRFQGWGEIKSLLYPADISWSELPNISKHDLEMETAVKEFYSLLKEKFPDKHATIIENIRGAILTSFYTPKEIPDVIFEKLYQKNKEIHSFLDPSAGSGIYMDSFLEMYPNCERVVGVEKDPLTALVLTAKYKGNPNITIYSKGFEEVAFKEKFDVIASNIPFGNFKVFYPEYPKSVTDKIHNFFFYHSQNLLNKSGFLSFITSSGVFNSAENEDIRRRLNDNGELLNLLTLPNNTFVNAGTEVTAQLFNYQNTGKPSSGTFVSSFQNDEGIQINQYVQKYFENSFLEVPQIGTNPYGTPEYQYKLPLEVIKDKLENQLFVPKLEVERPIHINENEELRFFPFENKKMSEVKSIQDQLKYVRKEIETDDNFRLLGVIKGVYKGRIVPFASVSKKGEDYYLETFVKNDIFKTKFENFEAKNVFKDKFPEFLDELTELCGKHQIKLSVDFRRIPEGFNFFKFVEKRYKKPVLDTFYVTKEEIPVAYHRDLQEGDISFTENKNPAAVEAIETLEHGQKFYKLKEINVMPEERLYIRNVFGTYHSFNDLNSIVSKIRKEEQRRACSQEEKIGFQSEIQKKVVELNKRYDTFVSKYGYISDQRNKRLDKYLSPYFPILKALENPTGDLSNLFSLSYEKADIFQYQYQFTTDKVLTAKSALVQCLQDKKEIDLEYIALLSKKEQEVVKTELGDIIVFNPIEKNFELKERFLSGNLYEKIEEVEKLPNSYIKESTLQLLKKVLPEKVPFANIKKQMGSRWLPVELIEKFVTDYYSTSFTIFSDADTDVFMVKPEIMGKGYIKYRCINGRYIRSEDIVENAYNDIYPIVTYSIEHDDGKKETKIDEEATNFYKREIANLQQSFDDYLLNLPKEIQKRLENTYNRLYNGNTHLSFDNDLLDFSNINLEALGVKQMYDHQKQAVWKILQNHGGIVDHEVGFGKTLTIIGLGDQLKKLGIAKKPMIIGLKANVSEIAHSYKKAFPNAKILFATEKDYSKAKREIFLNRIKTNDWDVVIMSHSQFQYIPQNSKVELEIMEKELHDLEANLLEVKGKNFSKSQLRTLQASKNNIRAKITGIQDKLRKEKDENVINFEGLGIDHIIVDESHEFKNLGYQTRHSRVAGLGNTEGSQKAMNLLTAIRTIQKNTPNGNGGASFFSGTPISNSLTELFLLHKYLTPNELKNKYISNFDAWAANFAIKAVEFEANMVNQIVPKERFRYFVNLPELSQMYTSIAHVMNGMTSIVDRPEKNEVLLLNEQTPLQKRFFVKLTKFLKTKNPLPLNLERPINLDSKGKALSIIAMDLAFKASLDMRLINSQYPDDPDSKINVLVRKILDNYYRFEEQKGTQIIFCDTSTSKKKLSFEEMEENYKNNIFTSIYDDIKYKLMKSGIPEKEIAFVQEYSDNSKKELLSEKMKKGEIRFLIGGTQNAGTGINVQDRLCHISHLTIPWKPSELDQRNGRGFRKGNWIAKEHNENKIDISISGTAQTLDNYRIDLNKNKAKFISQIRTSSNINQRTVDEGELSEDSGMNLAEFQAQLSGDTSLLERHKVDKKIKELELEKTFFQNQKTSLENTIEDCMKRDKELDVVIGIMKQDVTMYENNIQYDEKGSKVNNAVYIGLGEKPSNEEITKYLKNEWELIRRTEEGYSKVVGTLCGFDLVMENRFMGAVAYARNPNNPRVSYDSTKGVINFDGDKTAQNYYMNCLTNIERRYKYNQEEKKANIEKLKYLRDKTVSKFEKEDELISLYKEKEILDEQIKSNNSAEIRLPTVQKTIEGEEKTIPMINSIKEMERALLYDMLGEEDKMKAILTNDGVLRVLEKLEEKEIVEIQTNYYDEYHKKQYIRFKYQDGDDCYIHFSQEMKQEQVLVLEKNKNNIMNKIL